MGNGVNLVVVAGELAYDPDIRTSKKGMTATFVIPIDEFWTDPNTGISHKRTEWIRIVAFNKNAQQAAAYLRKGSSVHVQGSHRTDNYRDKNTGAITCGLRFTSRLCDTAE